MAGATETEADRDKEVRGRAGGIATAWFVRHQGVGHGLPRFTGDMINRESGTVVAAVRRFH
jgi:hypothetical protein